MRIWGPTVLKRTMSENLDLTAERTTSMFRWFEFRELSPRTIPQNDVILRAFLELELEQSDLEILAAKRRREAAKPQLKAENSESENPEDGRSNHGSKDRKVGAIAPQCPLGGAPNRNRRM